MTQLRGPGIHSIPENHTTYSHIESFMWSENQTLTEAWNYASGKLPPHYPVPALRCDVSLTLTDMLWIHYDAPIEWWAAEKPNVTLIT